MDIRKLNEKIEELAAEVNYPCKKTNHLKFVFKLSPSPDHVFFESGIRTVGRSVLDLVNSHYLFTRGYTGNREIDEAKAHYQENKPYEKYAKEHNLYRFVYNHELFGDEIKRGNKDFPKAKDIAFVERLVGAMYYDSDFETCKEWIINNLGIRAFKKIGSINK